jgi:Zn-dependent protease
MFTGSVRVGRLAGIPLLAHWSLVLIAALVGVNLLPEAGVVGFAVAISGFLASIVLHELSHAVVARRYGVSTTSIELWALGGIARLDREAPSPRADGWIAAAGPITSGLLGAIFIGGAFGLDAIGVGWPVTGVVFWLGLVNAVLAVFNLLPGAPLDGGRILRAIRWARHGDRYRAAQDAARTGVAVGWVIAAIGIWLLFNGVSSIMVIVTGLFLAVNAKAELMASQLSARLVGVRVRDLTWFGVAHAPPGTDAETMLWQRDRLGTPKVVAVEGNDGQLKGLVAEDQLWMVPEPQRPGVLLTQLMVPFSRLARAELDEEVTSVLPRLNPLAPMVTVWREGRLVGVVTADALKRKMADALRG